MLKKLSCALLLAVTHLSLSQECAFGTSSNTTGIGENIATGGSFEYIGAADFDVPFGTTFTASQIKLHLLKGTTDLPYVNVAILKEHEGLPGDALQTFDGLVPTVQTLAYAIDDPFLASYEITLELPTEVVLEKGKYFLKIAAAPGDAAGAWWEITAEDQRYGVFDYSQFGDEPWGGTGYYNKVFQVLGSCADSGEVMPDLGNPCEQGNPSNAFEGGMPLIANGQIVSVADDFNVPENTIFHLTDFTMHTLLLSAGLTNATINIRSSADGVPGEILHSFVNKGPAYEEFHGYWPFPGLPFDVVSVQVNFSFQNEPIELTTGNYFIEVIPTPYATEFLTWETTTIPGIGENSYTSYDGINWILNDGFQQVFTVGGFCSDNLGTNVPQASANLAYYPNPVKDVLRITASKTISNIAVYNMQGREINGCKLQEGAIDMQALASGIYMVKAQFDNGNFEMFKVVKE